MSSVVVEPNSEALVAFAFRFGLHDLEAADLSSRGNVGATVGLLIESDDVDHSDLGDRLRDQIHFSTVERHPPLTYPLLSW